MAGSNTCFSLVRGRAMRVTRLDGCGAVDLGPDSSIVSDGFITVQLTAQTDEGETISVTNAAGKVCILDEPCPVFTGYEIQVEFCGVNPLLYELMTGQPSVLDADGNRVGLRMNSKIDACDSGFALEVWSSVPTAVCDPSSGVSYGYFLVPFIKGGVIGDFTIGNDAVNFTLSGAKSKDGNNWGYGPYDVVKDDTGAAGPLLEEVDPNDHLWMQLTTVPPPEPSCDAVPVWGDIAITAIDPDTAGPNTQTDYTITGVDLDQPFGGQVGFWTGTDTTTAPAAVSAVEVVSSTEIEASVSLPAGTYTVGLMDDQDNIISTLPSALTIA